MLRIDSSAPISSTSAALQFNWYVRARLSIHFANDLSKFVIDRRIVTEWASYIRVTDAQNTDAVIR